MRAFYTSSTWESGSLLPPILSVSLCSLTESRSSQYLLHHSNVSNLPNCTKKPKYNKNSLILTSSNLIWHQVWMLENLSFIHILIAISGERHVKNSRCCSWWHYLNSPLTLASCCLSHITLDWRGGITSSTTVRFLSTPDRSANPVLHHRRPIISCDCRTCMEQSSYQHHSINLFAIFQETT